MRNLAAFISVVFSLALLLFLAGSESAIRASETDRDGDGFSNERETYLGTDPNYACAQVIGVHDAWPADINIDRTVNEGDQDFYVGQMGKAVAEYPELLRLDLNGDGMITVMDVLELIPYWEQSC